MKALHSAIALSLFGLAGLAQAGHHNRDYTDWAYVTRAVPQYERVSVPRRECRNEVVYRDGRGHRDDERSYGGAVIGGLTGGIVGNQVGKGSGRVAATAVGAVVGAIVGDRIDNDGYRRADYAPRAREVQRCHTVEHWEKRLTGYQVHYEYKGHHYSRFMTEDPGRRFKVKVSVDPAGRMHHARHGYRD